MFHACYKIQNIVRRFFFLMHAQKWPLFLPETREGNPPFRVDTKNAGVINNSRGNYQLLPLTGEQLRNLPWHRDFFVIFFTIKCRHLTDQKVSSLPKLESMGSQLHRCDNLQLMQNCFCRIF